MRNEITTLEQLREVIGTPLAAALNKDRQSLVPEHIAWLTKSPMCPIGTSALDGSCDVSPKGDPAGSVAHVIDEHTIAIPERKGNKRADGYRNILQNPHVGLLFLVPGRGDTLRINGRATILSDADYIDALVVKGHRPEIVIEVAIEQVFFHCSKAFLRSHLWSPETWAPDAIPSRAQIAKALERPEVPIEELEAYYGSSYSDGLY